MEFMQRKAFMGLVALTIAAATPALAQDTTTTGRTPQPGQQPNDSLSMPGQGGGADTAGFSGIERNDPSGARDPGVADTGATETGAVRTDTSVQRADTSSQAAPQASTGTTAPQSPDPNGFRWTEPGDFAKAGPTPPTGATGAVQPNRPSDSETETGAVKPSGSDSTKWGRESDKNPDVQNPPGYRGMERDTTQVPPGAAEPSDSTN